MKYVLIIMLFGKCPAVTSIEYSSYNNCVAVMEAMQQNFDRNHTDGSLSCVIKD